MGARWAVVTDPLANEIATANFVNVNVGGNVVTQGDRIPVMDFAVTCTDSACSCAGADCGTLGTLTYNTGAFDKLRDTMRRVFAAIQDRHVLVGYRGSRLESATASSGGEGG